MLSKRLAAPFLIGALIVLYLTWERGTSYAIYIVPFVIALAVIFVMSPQIDWWWAKRKPPALPEKLVELLERFSPFFQILSLEEKKRFASRTEMWMMGTEWMPQGWESVPKDVQTALASYGVMLTFRTDLYVLEKFEKIIMYQHPFPSPLHPVWHNSELYEDDGCLLFSAEHLMQGFFAQSTVYNIGLHEYAKAFVLSFPEKKWPSISDAQVADLEQVSGYGIEQIEGMIGLSVDDFLPIAVHHYFIFEEIFRAVFPDIAADFDGIFARG